MNWIVFWVWAGVLFNGTVAMIQVVLQYRFGGYSHWVLAILHGVLFWICMRAVFRIRRGPR